MNSKSLLICFKECSLITIGALAYVLGWIIFLIPNNMIGGGVTGLSSIIQYATGIKMGYPYFIINLGLLIAAVYLLGKAFGIKSVYAIALTAMALNFCQDLIPRGIIESLALNNGKLMCTIMGGILSGVGVGLSISQGGSTGGTDIIALLITRYRNVSPGRVILMVDVVVMLTSLLVPSYMADGRLMPWAEKITTVVYGFILVMVNTTVVDLYLSGARQSVQLLVFSKKYEEIADFVTANFHRGVTVLDGKGWYTKDNLQVLLILTKKTDLRILLKYINSVDPSAFISVASVNSVYGQGFDVIKNSKKKKNKV